MIQQKHKRNVGRMYRNKYSKYKQEKCVVFLDKHLDLAKLSDMFDLLELINSVIECELFCDTLEEAILPKQRNKRDENLDIRVGLEEELRIILT